MKIIVNKMLIYFRSFWKSMFARI